jgi:histidine triad (HIT) family protein
MTYPTFIAGGDPTGPCEFCRIVSGELPKKVRHNDDDLVVFHNALTWVPVMYLIIPKVHMTQAEFWRSPLFAKASALGVDLGESDCPDGFRLLANFGEHAAQTQLHGHLHVLGGGELGLYMDFPRKGDYWLRHMGYTEYDPDRQRRTPPAPDATNQESPQ